MVVARLFADDVCDSISCRSSTTAETPTDMTFKSKHTSGATTPSVECVPLQSSQLAELKRIIPPEEMQHLPRLERLIARVRELEMQSAPTFSEDGLGKAVDDDGQVDAQASKIANLEKQVSYYSERCAQLETILFEEGRTSQFHHAVYKLLSATHTDGKNVQRSLRDQAAVIAQLQDVVHSLSNQLDSEKDRTRSLTAQLVAAATGKHDHGRETPHAERKQDQPTRFYTTGSDDYAQRVVEAAVKGSVGSSLEVVIEQTPDKSVRQDLSKRLQHEFPSARRGHSVDTARTSASALGTQRGSPCSTQRGSPRALTPRATRRDIAADQKRPSQGPQGQPSSKPSTPLVTPRMVHRSPALPPRGPAAGGAAASNVVWAPEQRRPTLFGGG